MSNPKARRIEIRFPDPMNSGYLIFAALMMAGLDGIKNQIDPGAPSDKDLYDLPPEEEKNIPTVCHSLDQALEALDKDREFLKAGGVFTDDFIDGYIDAEDAGSHQVPRGDASARVPDVLRASDRRSRPRTGSRLLFPGRVGAPGCRSHPQRRGTGSFRPASAIPP